MFSVPSVPFAFTRPSLLKTRHGRHFVTGKLPFSAAEPPAAPALPQPARRRTLTWFGRCDLSSAVSTCCRDAPTPGPIVSTDPDRLLLERLRAADPTVVDDIGTRYAAELRIFCQRMVFNEALAEDLVQEVLMRCCKVEPSQVPTGSLRGWLYRVARNRCIDELRRMHPQQRLTAAQSGQTRGPAIIPVDPATTPAGKVAKQDRTAKIQLVVDGMEDDLREVVVMHFFQGLSTSEIADALELSVSGAKARLARATKLLRTRLKSLNEAS